MSINDKVWLTDQTKLDSNGNEILDAFGRKIYEETPWFVAKFPNPDGRKRIKDVIAVELTGKDLNGDTKTQKGKNAGC